MLLCLQGMWQKMEDIICDDKDREYLRKIRKEYKKILSETFGILLIEITKKSWAALQ